VRRLLLPILAVAIAAAAALYLLVLREKTVVADVRFPTPVAAIGVGDDAAGVAANGEVLEWLHPEEESLPLLPISEPPKTGRLGGPALQQVRLLGAAPAELRPYLRSSSYDEETGIEVELRSGIELRFGDATQAKAKWRAAAAVLADPSITELDYVDVQAPRRPAVGGSEHALPAPP
jgi:cell division septal protein FtsQ